MVAPAALDGPGTVFLSGDDPEAGPASARATLPVPGSPIRVR
jgi:hypothetical protein